MADFHAEVARQPAAPNQRLDELNSGSFKHRAVGLKAKDCLLVAVRLRDCFDAAACRAAVSALIEELGECRDAIGQLTRPRITCQEFGTVDP